MKEISQSYIKIECRDDAVPQYNRLQLRTDPPTFINLLPGENILSVEDYPALKYGFCQIDNPYLDGEDVPYERNCGGIISIDLSHFDASEMTSMDYMFKDMGPLWICWGNITTSQVTSMTGTFYGFRAEKRYRHPSKPQFTELDLSEQDLSKVKDVSGMFSLAKIDVLHLPKFSDLELMTGMFYRTAIKKIIFEGCDKYDFIKILREIDPENPMELYFDCMLEGRQIKSVINIMKEVNHRFKHIGSPMVTCDFDSEINYKISLIDKVIYRSNAQRIDDRTTYGSLFGFLWDSPAIREYPIMTKPFLNPFGEMTEKYTIFQGTPLNTLLGLKKVEELFPACTPTLPFGILISHFEQIRNSIFAKDFGKREEMVLVNLREALDKVEIFLVTTECEGKTHSVHNLLKNGEEEEQTVPKSQSICEGSGADALGMYVPATGSIYLWIDKIYSYRIYPLMFQSVLLHELIHLLFDVLRKGLKLPSDNSQAYMKTNNKAEETIDNCLMLYCYSQADSMLADGVEYALKEIRAFVESQSGPYREGGKKFDQLRNWGDMRVELIDFLTKKKKNVCF